jgi:hypothetical protein
MAKPKRNKTKATSETQTQTQQKRPALKVYIKSGFAPPMHTEVFSFSLLLLIFLVADKLPGGKEGTVRATFELKFV